MKYTNKILTASSIIGMVLFMFAMLYTLQYSTIYQPLTVDNDNVLLLSFIGIAIMCGTILTTFIIIAVTKLFTNN